MKTTTSWKYVYPLRATRTKAEVKLSIDGSRRIPQRSHLIPTLPTWPSAGIRKGSAFSKILINYERLKTWNLNILSNMLRGVGVYDSCPASHWNRHKFMSVYEHWLVPHKALFQPLMAILWDAADTVCSAKVSLRKTESKRRLLICDLVIKNKI